MVLACMLLVDSIQEGLVSADSAQWPVWAVTKCPQTHMGNIQASGSGAAARYLVLLSLTVCHCGAASSSVAWLPNSPALQSCLSRDAAADRSLVRLSCNV